MNKPMPETPGGIPIEVVNPEPITDSPIQPEISGSFEEQAKPSVVSEQPIITPVETTVEKTPIESQPVQLTEEQKTAKLDQLIGQDIHNSNDASQFATEVYNMEAD